MMGQVDRHDVPLADDVVDLPALIGEDPGQPEHRALDALETGGLVRSPPAATTCGSTTSANASTSQAGKISSKVRRAIALFRSMSFIVRPPVATLFARTHQFDASIILTK